MPNESLDRRFLVDILFVIIVFCLSLSPFTYPRGWDGYAPGTFLYQDETYYVRQSDKTMGSDKPHVFLLEGWPVKSQVDIIEFSDSLSYVNGLDLYEDLETYSRLSDGGLTVLYESNNSGVHLTKSISVTDDGVTVGYESDQPVELRLTFWRWYFTSVDGCDYRGMSLPLDVEPKQKLSFEFMEGSRTYRGILCFSSEPSNIEVCRDLNGLNKILIDYVGSCLFIGLSLEEANRLSFRIANRDLLFPLISVVLGLVYLKVGRHAVLVKIRPNRTEH